MNKIQLMYDVVKAMKAKENFKGTLQVAAKKDEVKIFGLANEFEKNTVTGLVKLKMNTEFDCDGQKLKHESNTEFTMKDGGCNRHRRFMEHLHRHHGMDRQPEQFGGRHCGGFKEGLNRIGFLLQVLNNIKLEEKPDQSYSLSLSLNDIPEECKQALHDHLNREEVQQHFAQCPHPGFFKEIHGLENPSFELKVGVNQNYEIVKVDWALNGIKKDEDGAQRKLDVKAELNLA